jgi:hypothetical protein
VSTTPESFDIQAEIERFLEPSSLPSGNPPQAVVIAGGTGAGKTRHRREAYGSGYVVLDAAEIFLSLCRGRYLDFPGPLEEPMDFVGYAVARRVFKEHRNFVVEMIGADFDAAKQFMDAMLAAGYKVECVPVICDVNVAWEWNVNRGKDNILAYYCEAYHRRWIMAAAIRGP